MKKITFVSGGDFAIGIEPHFVIENECYYCGQRTRAVIDKDDEYDRTEAEYWENKYKDFMGQVNSLLRHIEIETGWNPHKERLAKELVAIRDKFTDT